MDHKIWDAVIVGGGYAGTSAAIYIARATRSVLVLDAGQSIGAWEPKVENFFGFPESISGKELLDRGRLQAEKFGAKFVEDTIVDGMKENEAFLLKGKKGDYRGSRCLLATGALHIPPDIPEVNSCLGVSMFFCKDCDGLKVRGKRVAVIGSNNDAVEYALGLSLYSGCVVVLTNGKTAGWDDEHAKWLQRYEVSCHTEKITEVCHDSGQISCVRFENGLCVEIEALFTTRGDIFHNGLARSLGATLDEYGQIVTGSCGQTDIPGLFAAGCVTPANCQMIVAAGEGAAAGQKINRSLFEESIVNGKLFDHRAVQIAREQTEPCVTKQPAPNHK
ncbi:MAG: putative Thioredoxin reductase [Verrucomicrobiales bacterium]|nr:putative Thioredoxin reductase [Verrucomicrobiales bacterium]